MLDYKEVSLDLDRKYIVPSVNLQSYNDMRGLKITSNFIFEIIPSKTNYIRIETYGETEKIFYEIFTVIKRLRNGETMSSIELKELSISKIPAINSILQNQRDSIDITVISKVIYSLGDIRKKVIVTFEDKDRAINFINSNLDNIKVISIASTEFIGKQENTLCEVKNSRFSYTFDTDGIFGNDNPKDVLNDCIDRGLFIKDESTLVSNLLYLIYMVYEFKNIDIRNWLLNHFTYTLLKDSLLSSM